jgi:hypothetical protein
MTNIMLGIILLFVMACYWGICITIKEIRKIHFTCGCSGLPIKKEVLEPRPGGRVRRPMKVITDEQLFDKGE